MNDAIFPNSGLDSYFHPHQDQRSPASPVFARRGTGDRELLEQFGFIPGLKEFLVIRQVHALEHATVWMLSDAVNSQTKLSTSYLSADNETIGGLSTEKGFYLYGEINPLNLRRAVNLALIRLQQGEWNLALHPRCGTNSSVAAILTAGMAVTAHFALPRSPFHQIMGMGLAAIAANYLAPDLGIYVQKYITTAIPFNLNLHKITQITDKSGKLGYFVQLNWSNNN